MLRLDTIGKRLWFFRLMLQKTQGDISDITQIKLAILNKAEQNKYFLPADALLAIAQRLGVNPSWLVHGTAPIFSNKLAMINFSSNFQRKGVRFSKNFRDKAFIKDAFIYLAEMQGFESFGLLRDGHLGIFIFSCKDMHFFIMRVDVFTAEVIREASEEARLPAFVRDVGLLQGNEGLREIYSGIDTLYARQTGSGDLKPLRASCSRYLEEKKESKAPKIFRALNKMLTSILPEEVYSPVIFGVSKIQRLVNLALEIDATPEDLAEVAKIIKYN